jgi:hypothetical protein
MRGDSNGTLPFRAPAPRPPPALGRTSPTAAAAPGMRAQSRYCTVNVTGTGRRLFVRSLLVTQMSAE